MVPPFLFAVMLHLLPLAGECNRYQVLGSRGLTKVVWSETGSQDALARCMLKILGLGFLAAGAYFGKAVLQIFPVQKSVAGLFTAGGYIVAVGTNNQGKEGLVTARAVLI